MRHELKNVCWAAASIVLAALVAGCSGSDGRQAVTGTVTLDGQPLESGAINFQPVDAKAASSSGGAVHDGKFEVRSDKGLLPGKYKVSIRATRETGRMIDDPQMGRIADRAIVKYREEGALEATVGQGKNEFHFKLTSIR